MSGLNDSDDFYSQNYGNAGDTSSNVTAGYKPFSSPYLNYDPGYLPSSQPEFIFLDGGSKQRGRFELAFGQIGGSCMIGAGIGGASGFYNGLKTTTLAGQTGKLRRTQMINHVMKKGSATANTFGSIAVIYSAFGVFLSWARGTDDDLNTIVAATATGCLYKSTAGLRRCGLGGAIGFGLSTLYALWNNMDKLAELRQFNPAEMDQGAAERRLAVIFTFCVIAGAVASITPGVAWSHWKGTLDQCIDRNCSCILYGEYTRTIFLGGDASSCIWVTFGPLIYVLFSIGFACFHGYRVLFSSNTPRTRTIMAKDETGETIQMSVQNETTDPLPRTYWITSSTLSVFFTLYALIHFAIFMDGFLYTCNKYRRTLELLLGLHGTAIPVIYNRLSCISIFDFMDYMQPDTGNAYRDGFIFTGIDLTIGLAASLFSWILFLIGSIININMARIKL